MRLYLQVIWDHHSMCIVEKIIKIKRLFELVAEDAVIEDLLYYLLQGLVDNKMDIESYLKQVRSLSRDQFFKRALVKKMLDP